MSLLRKAYGGQAFAAFATFCKKFRAPMGTIVPILFLSVLSVQSVVNSPAASLLTVPALGSRSRANADQMSGIDLWLSAPPRSSVSLNTTNLGVWTSRFALGSVQASGHPPSWTGTNAVFRLIHRLTTGAAIGQYTNGFTIAALIQPKAGNDHALVAGSGVLSTDPEDPQQKLDWGLGFSGGSYCVNLAESYATPLTPLFLTNGPPTSGSPLLLRVPDTNQPALLIASVNRSNVLLRVNGTAAVGYWSRPTNFVVSAQSSFHLGYLADSGGTNQLGGSRIDLYELVLVNHAFEVTESLRLENIMRRYYPGLAFSNTAPYLATNAAAVTLSGPECAGPFVQTALQIANLGNGDLTWTSQTNTSSSGSAAWVTISPAAGTLIAGTTQMITVSVTPGHECEFFIPGGTVNLGITNTVNHSGDCIVPITMSPF